MLERGAGVTEGLLDALNSSVSTEREGEKSALLSPTLAVARTWSLMDSSFCRAKDELNDESTTPEAL